MVSALRWPCLMEDGLLGNGRMGSCCRYVFTHGGTNNVGDVETGTCKADVSRRNTSAWTVNLPLLLVVHSQGL